MTQNSCRSSTMGRTIAPVREVWSPRQAEARRPIGLHFRNGVICCSLRVVNRSRKWLHRNLVDRCCVNGSASVMPVVPVGTCLSRSSRVRFVSDNDQKGLFRMKMKRISVAAASLACCAAVLVPSAANAQEQPSPVPSPSTQEGDQGTNGEVGTLDADVSNGWVKMYLSGYPSRWYAALSNNVPGGAGLGHYEVYGPNGYHWNSPERYNPSTSATGTGAGTVCAQLWIKQSNGSYLSAGRPCANVY